MTAISSMPAPKNTKPLATISFTATLHGPANVGQAVLWTFLRLPSAASKKLPSRGMVSVEGTLNGAAFRATLEPDGDGGHWLKIPKAMRLKAKAEPGNTVTLEITPVDKEPEPKMPADLRSALATAPSAKKAWSTLTPAARRDWIHWIISPKQAATRAKRIATTCSMLIAGKRRPCCFDRSGMYSKSLSCPIAADAPP